MKYLVVRVAYNVKQGDSVVTEVAELPIVFSDKLVHADMADGAVIAARHEIANWQTTQVVGAGFVTFANDEAHCYGKSESLNIASRKELDSGLITNLFFA